MLQIAIISPENFHDNNFASYASNLGRIPRGSMGNKAYAKVYWLLACICKQLSDKALNIICAEYFGTKQHRNTSCNKINAMAQLLPGTMNWRKNKAKHIQCLTFMLYILNSASRWQHFLVIANSFKSMLFFHHSLP